MTKFDFNGKIYEDGQRVLTQIEPTIEITSLESDENPYGYLQIFETEDDDNVIGRNKLKMELSLPKGDSIEIDENVTVVDPPPTTPYVILTQNENNKYHFTFGIPKGEKGDPGQDGRSGPKGDKGDKGEKGSKPVVTIAETVTLPSGQNARVEDLNTSSDDVAFKFSIPRGDTGKPGSSARISEVNVRTLESGSSAYVNSETTYDADTDTNITSMMFGIPRGNVATFGIGDVTRGETPDATLRQKNPGTEEDKDFYFDFVLPKGDTGAQGPRGEAGDIADITESGDYTAVTSIGPGINPTTGNVDYHYLLIEKDGIPASDITSGTLPVTYGGTGASTVAGAISNLGLDTVIQEAVDEIIVIDDEEPLSANTKI